MPGDSVKHSTALPIRLVVVSLPATSNRLQNPSNSMATEFLPVDLGREERADQIIARLAPPLLDHAHEVLRHFPVGGSVVGLVGAGAGLAYDHVRPLLEPVPV